MRQAPAVGNQLAMRSGLYSKARVGMIVLP